jgi:hypothetical protein
MIMVMMSMKIIIVINNYNCNNKIWFKYSGKDKKSQYNLEDIYLLVIIFFKQWWKY